MRGGGKYANHHRRRRQDAPDHGGVSYWRSPHVGLLADRGEEPRDPSAYKDESSGFAVTRINEWPKEPAGVSVLGPTPDGMSGSKDATAAHREQHQSLTKTSELQA